MHCFDIGEHGACPDGTTMNTAAIQAAIDACHESGGGTVICGPGSFLTGSLVLRSNVELHLAPGCRLVGSPRVEDYADFVAPGFRPAEAAEGNTKTLVRAVGAENVAITGAGEINGSGLAFYDTSTCDGRFFRKPPTARPRLVMFYECRNVRFEDASFVDSPCWTMWLMKCERVTIQRVRVCGDQRMINNDGIDLDSCRDVTVSDSIFKTADDCLVLRAIRQVFDAPGVCENITVTNCVLDSWCQGIRVGCPGDSVIRNSTFSNLTITSSNHGISFENPVRYVPADGRAGADVHDIMFSNVTIDCVKIPVRIVIEDGVELERLGGLSFADMRIRSGSPCVIQGSLETPVRDVSFSNVRIETSGDDAIVCRHCRGVKLTNVELGTGVGGPP